MKDIEKLTLEQRIMLRVDGNPYDGKYHLAEQIEELREAALHLLMIHNSYDKYPVDQWIKERERAEDKLRRIIDRTEVIR